MGSSWGIRSLLAATLVGCLLAFALAAGCIPMEGESPPEWLGVEEQTEEVVEGEEADSETPKPGGGHHGNEVMMMGRSVMEGWFSYWGWDWETPVRDRGYVFYYYNLDGPPGIGSDGAAQVAEAPDGTILFFKLCFDDFWASNDSDVGPMAAEALGWVDEVIAAAEGRDVTLIIGNALPKVRSDTTPALVNQHRAYNAGLEERASMHGNVWVFDQYSVLAGSDGSLPKGLSVSPGDSHLNTTAYAALDAEFVPLLDEIPGGVE